MGKAKSKTAPAGTANASNVTLISAAGRSKQNAPAAEAAADTAPPVVGASLVVFGRDDGGKPHASGFAAGDAELAIKAAGLMRFKVLPITSDEHRTAASGLAAGRVFASGRCFSPFCREAAYGALEAFPEAYQPPAPVEPEPVPAPAIAGTPQTWENIGPGSLVLASMGDDTGWFEAVVAEARGYDLFVLRWRGWPEDAEFARRRDGLALLPPPVAEPGTSATADPAAQGRPGDRRWQSPLRHPWPHNHDTAGCSRRVGSDEEPRRRSLHGLRRAIDAGRATGCPVRGEQYRP